MSGINVSRVFTRAGEDPFESVEWGFRDAVIYNKDGSVHFEQKNIEAPKSWSDQAVNVVAQKYFYGDERKGTNPAVGGRETSIRQLIYRVARTFADWGKEDGYFATEQDAEVFYDELVWLLVNQHGAFNSPVWFNVGLNHIYWITASKPDDQIFGWIEDKNNPSGSGRVDRVDPYERPQGSACFIIRIEDSIESIWQSVSESARLFKFGSGVGADWSRLRSSKDTLSGGGQPSGPVSFMRVQDATGGTIKSGGKTRRAAIMQTLKVWHPDIEEFVLAKQREELKAHALIEQGYDGSFNGPAYGSVAFQNVNQSVRVTDDFMATATSIKGWEEGEDNFPLKSPATGEVLGTVNARTLLMQIAEGTHICGDPGVQYEDTIQHWHTCANDEPINSTNPCSEFSFLDSTSCNLASLNLRKFQREDGTFDVTRYKAAVRIFITAQEILVDRAGYPSAEIAQRTHDYRPLGLGYANLGALLMSMGLSYDSPRGRAFAACLTAIMTGEGYGQSAYIAGVTGSPFPAFERNKSSMMKVMRQHREAVDLIGGKWLEGEEYSVNPDGDADLHRLMKEARLVWDEAILLGEEHGYRNAQISVLAPTGTIGFFMDCDTTGIEPAIALVSYKLLAGKGDGLLKIVNQTVPEALARLGYTEEQRKAILDYIDKHDMIEGAPGLKEEHLPVFDCAFKPTGGSRSIHYMGHVKMMAACQPFLSGAISKTCNVPEDATVEDIFNVYVEGWRLGLKAIAIYRENSKKSQPLNTKKLDAPEQKTNPALVEAAKVEEAYLNGLLDGAKQHKRKRLPDERPSVTHKFSIAGHEGYLHVGLYPDTQMPGEIFITMAKQGSTISGLMDAYATVFSIALQYGVPLEDLCTKFAHMRFEPSGFTNNRKIPIAKSIVDYIARYLSSKFIEDRQEQKEISEAPVEAPVTSEVVFSGQKAGFVNETPLKTGFQNQADAPACSSCGHITVRSGSCYKCPNCGDTTGCS